MKRKGHIVDRITLADLRREAATLAASSRIRRCSADRFLERFEKEAPPILAAIRSGTWQPSPLRPRDIFEHGKLRHIEIPTFKDTLVQRVLCYPQLETLFVNHTWPHAYSSIKGRGPLRAAKHVSRLIRNKKARWCLYFDVRKYYLHIDRDIMKADLRRIVKDPIALRLLDRIVDMGEAGIAIGNTASHFLANLYLTPTVQRLAAFPGVADVVTYMDNVFVFGRSKRALHTVRREAVTLLACRGLAMKSDWQLFRTDLRAVKIGGYRVQNGQPWRIYRATFRHLRRRVREFRRRQTVSCARSIASLKGWITTAGCTSFYKHHIHPTWLAARKVIQNESKTHLLCGAAAR